MAENTYKKNTPKPKEEKEQKEKGGRKSKAKKSGAKLNLEFLQDKRLHLAVGSFLMLFSFCLVIAFVSYLFTIDNDQSIVESLFSGSIIESGKETRNWLGLTGAVLSYYFIYKWFGIAAF